ncbi:WhiB family transcriptional regulator [Streptomyces sp. NPDC048332]|uniref:WhiB family transcriptional regulator n=1 Tax=Streptomyces sp. NPDC048332 TaxID=3154619 RepID=UPI003437E576
MIELPAFLDGTAICARTEHDPDLWHSALPTDEATAAAHCRACPLRQACADYALNNGEQRGTWGGLTARDRRRLLRPDDQSWVDGQGRVRRPCGTDAAYWAHRRLDEACEVCETARARKVLETAHAKGGTVNGAKLHRRLGEAVCDACLGAERRAWAARPAEQRTRKTRGRAQQTEAGPALALAS